MYQASVRAIYMVARQRRDLYPSVGATFTVARRGWAQLLPLIVNLQYGQQTLSIHYSRQET